MVLLQNIVDWLQRDSKSDHWSIRRACLTTWPPRPTEKVFMLKKWRLIERREIFEARERVDRNVRKYFWIIQMSLAKTTRNLIKFRKSKMTMIKMHVIVCFFIWFYIDLSTQTIAQICATCTKDSFVHFVQLCNTKLIAFEMCCRFKSDLHAVGIL